MDLKESSKERPWNGLSRNVEAFKLNTYFGERPTCATLNYTVALRAPLRNKVGIPLQTPRNPAEILTETPIVAGTY